MSRSWYVCLRELCSLLLTIADVVSGSATFVGLGAFTYVSGHSQLKSNEATIRASKSIFGMRSRRAAITSTASIMVGLGVYRWFS